MYKHILLKCHGVYANALKNKFNRLLAEDNSPEMSLYKELREKIFNEIVNRNNASDGYIRFILSKKEEALIVYFVKGYYGGWYAKWSTPYGHYLKAELGGNLCVSNLSFKENHAHVILTVSWDDPQKMFESYTNALRDIGFLIKKPTC